MEKQFDRYETQYRKNWDFMSILYNKPLREYKKPTFKIDESVRISQYDLLFRKGYKPQFISEVF